MKTLHFRKRPLSEASAQRHSLNHFSQAIQRLPKFQDKLKALETWPLRSVGVDTLQMNLGKLCNQICGHCHVDAGPDRKEIMSQETMLHCLKAMETSHITQVDLTGGAPEMNPHFPWLVEEIRKRGRQVIVRCNLTILLAGEKYADLPRFYAQHQVHLISSLPCFEKKNTDSQRGNGVFEKSIAALKKLNEVGYGHLDSPLQLDLVYKPSGPVLPGPQKELEIQFKNALKGTYGIEFNKLYTITNLPLSRFLDFLIETNAFEKYMELLVNHFNPKAIPGVMCRKLLSVGWDGYLYDCDFNQMLEIGITNQNRSHIKDFDYSQIATREISIDQHCYGCTAGQGSSCSGSIT